MNRTEFKRQIMAMHQDSPQRAALVEMSITGLFECLDKLATYGHSLEVRPAEYLYAGEEFPKMMYHGSIAPGGKVFHTEQSMPSEVGWQDTPISQAEPEGPQEPSDQDRPGINEPGEGDLSVYPKKLYHADMPGGIEVPNAETEDEYKSRGYSEEPPDRGDVNFGSRTARFEGQDGGRPETSTAHTPAPQAMRAPVAPKNGKKG